MIATVAHIAAMAMAATFIVLAFWPRWRDALWLNTMAGGAALGYFLARAGDESAGWALAVAGLAALVTAFQVWRARPWKP